MEPSELTGTCEALVCELSDVGAEPKQCVAPAPNGFLPSALPHWGDPGLLCTHLPAPCMQSPLSNTIVSS